MNNTIDQLKSYFCPYWWADLQAVCNIGDALELNEQELFDIIDEWKWALEASNFDDIDPVAAIMEYALQEARNHIEQITGYDFMNDFGGVWNSIYTAGNYLASSYDCGDAARAELQEKIQWYGGLLSESAECRYVLGELDIELSAERG